MTAPFIAHEKRAVSFDTALWIHHSKIISIYVCVQLRISFYVLRWVFRNVHVF